MRQGKLTTTIILATAVIACAPSPSKGLEENKNLVLRFTESLNAADWDALDTVLTEDFRRHSQASGDPQVRSREAFKELQKSFLESMPDQKVTIDTLIAEDDLVAVYATYSGTQTGPMGPFPPTGRSVESRFLGLFRVEEGRIAELWVEWDNLAMLTQLGLYPPPTAAPGG